MTSTVYQTPHTVNVNASLYQTLSPRKSRDDSEIMVSMYWCIVYLRLIHVQSYNKSDMALLPCTCMTNLKIFIRDSSTKLAILKKIQPELIRANQNPRA